MAEHQILSAITANDSLRAPRTCAAWANASQIWLIGASSAYDTRNATAQVEWSAALSMMSAGRESGLGALERPQNTHDCKMFHCVGGVGGMWTVVKRCVPREVMSMTKGRNIAAYAAIL